MIDQLEARSQVFDKIVDLVTATDWQTEIQYPNLNMYFQGRSIPAAPPADVPHIKCFIKHADGGNASLTGGNGYQIFENDAGLIVQCFGPMARGDGLEVAIKVATILKQAFQGSSTPGCIWFRRCRAEEQDPSGNWDQCNMTCILTYDEVQRNGL